jgi:hypothetical protein
MSGKVTEFVLTTLFATFILEPVLFGPIKHHCSMRWSSFCRRKEWLLDREAQRRWAGQPAEFDRMDHCWAWWRALIWFQTREYRALRESARQIPEKPADLCV